MKRLRSISNGAFFIYHFLVTDPTENILGFLREIGLGLTEGNLPNDTFLPGIEIVDGGLVVDKTKLKYPGDLLHEAAHLAIAPASIRASLSGEVEIPGTDPPVLELAAMLWSYAACIHLQLEPHVVFHDDGYHGQAGALIRTFELGVDTGVQVLVEAGMTSADAFPAMRCWLRG